ncbi:serine/threonine-protein kinase [Candidatus Eisenbacteria bacterium]|uniref:Serine/threonine-protein kinase n=1 Tax=Eiseniibacteriota bacterium TaxID=2212470 RepID=A0ABV6YIA3_UNCEI
MDDRDRLLESLGLDVSDGKDPDWSALEATAGGDRGRELIENLRSLSVMARFYRELREQDQATRDGDGAERAVDKEDKPSPASSGRDWGHLEILEEIGHGTYGTVYRARDTRLNREVALKLIPDAEQDDAPRLTNLPEAELLARVRHPNLVTIHGAEARQGHLGLWMEFIRGVTLHDLIAEQGPLSAREAILHGIDLCGALAALHAAGLLHRDIKAHNVMREVGGRVVLMDLGAGTELRADASPRGPHLSGTPLYMAPETLAGGEADVRSETYSLGVVLYYIVTGTYPLAARTLEDLQEQHRRGVYRRLRDIRPDLPAGFVNVIERAISPEPARRFATAGDMEQALAAALGVTGGAPDDRGADSVPRSAPVGVKPEVRTRDHRVTFLLGLASVMILVIALFLWPGFLVGKGYTVSATLHRAGQPASEQLLPGSHVTPGDRLFIEFEASRAMHVYVLAEDDKGEAFLLFPIRGQAAGNPLPGNHRHRLPPDEDGNRFSWGVSSAGGTEHILIVASPDALGDFETTLAALPAPRQPGTPAAVPLDQNALRGLRGIGHLVEIAPSDADESPRPAFALARQLAAGPERGRGIWVRQIDLINPGP